MIKIALFFTIIFLGNNYSFFMLKNIYNQYFNSEQQQNENIIEKVVFSVQNILINKYGTQKELEEFNQYNSLFSNQMNDFYTQIVVPKIALENKYGSLHSENYYSNKYIESYCSWNRLLKNNLSNNLANLTNLFFGIN
jgi:hypothetical protein